MKDVSKRSFFTMINYIVLTVLAAVVLIPILNVLLCTIKNPSELANPISLPSGFYIGNYMEALKSGNFFKQIFNSVVVTSGSVFLSVILCSFAAYPIARRKEKIFWFAYLFFLSAMMIPSAANLVTLYVIVKKLYLIDKLTGLITIYMSVMTPMGILLFTGFIKTVPVELDEAAMIDGCGYLKRFAVAVLPLLKPVTVAFCILNGLVVWNDLLTPLIIIRSPGKLTATQGIYSFFNTHGADWGAVYALLTIMMIPPIGFFIIMHKHFMSGIATGVLKG